jgi:hypothetical protein
VCPVSAKEATLLWYGYAIDGVSLHCLELDDALLEAPGSVMPNAVIVIINDLALHVKLTPSVLEQDLKWLVSESWDWKIKQINSKLCKNTGGMTLPVSKVVVMFVYPKPDPSSGATLCKI